MNNPWPWLNGFSVNPTSKLYPPLAPVLIPSFFTQTPSLNSLPFNGNLSSSSNGSNSSTASSPFSFSAQSSLQKLSPECVERLPKPEKSTSNENLFPTNKSLASLSAKSQLFLIERLFPQLASAINNAKHENVSIKTPEQLPIIQPIQKPVVTPPINQVLLL
jgi:hypothetical protein